MLKKSITYTDLDGNSQTGDFYFNFSKAELVEMELSHKGGFSQYLQNIIKANDNSEIIANFKALILQAYGEKSEDGKRFVKSQELRNAFEQTDAYSELFIELATNAESAAEFINALVPQGLAEQIQQSVAKRSEVAAANPDLVGPVAVEKPPVVPGEAETVQAPKDPKDMTREELLEAFKQKNQA